jgi:hypothetical protein
MNNELKYKINDKLLDSLYSEFDLKKLHDEYDIDDKKKNIQNKINKEIKKSQDKKLILEMNKKINKFNNNNNNNKNKINNDNNEDKVK